MSVEDVKKIKSAYEKMFEDGSAYKKINMPMVLNEPNMNEVEGKPLGEAIKKSSKTVEPEPEEDFSDVDRRMQERLKARMSSLKGKTQDTDMVKEMNSLKQRVKTLEEALSLVMETQEKILGE